MTQNEYAELDVGWYLERRQLIRYWRQGVDARVRANADAEQSRKERYG
jgi:hypothetical protein